MKNPLILLFCALSFGIWAQAQQRIPYQAVVRNTDGSTMANAAVTITFKIHDNSATGTVVYEETHANTTNAQGLVSLNVGGGTTVTGTFSGIQWGTGSKFLHVLMNAGSGVVDLGTQQMMSVPYALSSNVAQNGISGVSQFGDSLFISDGSYIIIPGLSRANFPELMAGCADINACNFNPVYFLDSSCLYIGNTCNDNDSNTFNDLIDSNCVCVGTVLNNSNLQIGSEYQGGIIAYVFKPGDIGYVPNEFHGLIAASEDRANTEFDWACSGFEVAGADGFEIGLGKQNTLDIVEANCFGGAAHVCAYFVWNGYNDWYLPSRSELEEIYDNQLLIGGFQNTCYWTSSESDEMSAWVMSFDIGYANVVFNKNNFCRVRPVRSF